MKGAPLDALITRLVLEALEPAGLEASLQATADLAAERAALDRNWQQRRERARFVAERARRQYDAIEPENRLAVRTLERDWEQALTEQARLEAEYERFRREQLPAPGPHEIAALQSLAQDSAVRMARDDDDARRAADARSAAARAHPDRGDRRQRASSR